MRPPIAEIVLDRPADGNTFTPELLSELAAAAVRLATEANVRAVVVRGSGKNFCFGANIDMFLEEPADRRPALLRDLVTRFHVAITRLARLELPVLGVAHGMVVGGGLALLGACDVVLAAESTRFRMGWSGIGITMDGGATWTLPRIIGARRTLELISTNRIFTAAEAERWGLVNWLAPEADLEKRTAEIARTLAAGPTRALGLCKRLVIGGGSQSFETHLEDEAVALVEAVGTADADEGLRAFRERRPPRFSGR
ncbi:MAG: enoyl-CoA hydratase/isomerase family protein [Deltaproteobacteria bacterium]|nr:enoyl-CoA hydratase/isomerase family protein [Deltaproteobacteria bacterium]